MERPEGKYDNIDMEYWLKILKCLNPKHKNEIIRMLDQAKEILTEIKFQEIRTTNSFRLKQGNKHFEIYK
jgi:hypothetical protein